MTRRAIPLHVRTSAAKRARKSSSRMTKARARDEGRFHEATADFLDAMLPNDAWWTTFPAGGGGKVRGAILKRRGLKAGVPDIVIVQHGRCCWIELKDPNGTVSDEQTNTHADLVAVQSPVAVCRTLDGVHDALIRWGFRLKGKVAA